jgi:hypothetical protein
MPENDRIVLNTILERNNQEIAPELPPEQYFELFASEQVLKNADLSDEEIMSGIVRGGGDGGIDSIYVFINGNLLQEDSDLSKIGKDLTIDIKIMQAKLETGFGESTIQRFQSTVNDIFNLSKKLDEFKGVYNDHLLEIANNFRNIYTEYAQRFPKLNIDFYYITRGDEPHPNVKRLVANLKKLIISLFSSAKFSFSFFGAAEILNLARQTPAVSNSLRLAENPISSGEQSFICLVNVVDFFNFICDSEGRLQKRVFESNVRDYQGDVQVNQGIQNTLSNPLGDDFWWLNNGITLVATKAFLSGKTLTIEKPQIVNGMQTSFKIYKHFSETGKKEDQRNILVRVIGLSDTTEGNNTRNRIIQATNSQTRIPIASLRATDPVQFILEEYLKSFGFYYDRRKNYYKNERKPFNKIIPITYLAQGIMSVVLRRPNDARARPSTLLKEDENYKSVFNSEYPMPLYPHIIKILKHVESYLRQAYPSMTSTDRNNNKFHLAMFASLLISNNPNASVQEIIDINIDDMSTEFLDTCYKEVTSIYKSFKLGGYWGSKSRDVVSKLLERLKEMTYSTT